MVLEHRKIFDLRIHQPTSILKPHQQLTSQPLEFPNTRASSTETEVFWRTRSFFLMCFAEPGGNGYPAGNKPGHEFSAVLRISQGGRESILYRLPSRKSDRH